AAAAPQKPAARAPAETPDVYIQDPHKTAGQNRDSVEAPTKTDKPSRPRPKPISCPPAANGCMRSSTTASASLPARLARTSARWSASWASMATPPAFVTAAAAIPCGTREELASGLSDGAPVTRSLEPSILSMTGVRAIRASGPCDDNGVASFDLVRHHRANDSVFLYAFDLIELNGDDVRRDPLEVRKATLASIVATAQPGIRFNEHIEGDGPTVFDHACKLGLEGIVSKRKGSAYRSGRSPDWLKMKNSDAPAVRREAEEDWRK